MKIIKRISFSKELYKILKMDFLKIKLDFFGMDRCDWATTKEARSGRAIREEEIVRLSGHGRSDAVEDS